MKKLLIGLLALGSLSSFAQNSGFETMSIEEILHRGFAIEAEVIQDLGVRFVKGQVHYRKNACETLLRVAPDSDSILPKGKKITFIRKTYNGKRDGIRSEVGPVALIRFANGRNTSINTLARLEKDCGELFKFTVIERTDLVKL